MVRTNGTGKKHYDVLKEFRRQVYIRDLIPSPEQLHSQKENLDTLIGSYKSTVEKLVGAVNLGLVGRIKSVFSSQEEVKEGIRLKRMMSKNKEYFSEIKTLDGLVKKYDAKAGEYLNFEHGAVMELNKCEDLVSLCNEKIAEAKDQDYEVKQDIHSLYEKGNKSGHTEKDIARKKELKNNLYENLKGIKAITQELRGAEHDQIKLNKSHKILHLAEKFYDSLGQAHAYIRREVEELYEVSTVVIDLLKTTGGYSKAKNYVTAFVNKKIKEKEQTNETLKNFSADIGGYCRELTSSFAEIDIPDSAAENIGKDNERSTAALRKEACKSSDEARKRILGQN